MPRGVTFKVTMPPKLDEMAFWHELQTAVEDIGETIKSDYEKDTYDWSWQPRFEIERIDEPRRLGVHVWTDDPIHNILNKGAKRHPITGNPYLVYPAAQYVAKTSPPGGTKASAKAIRRYAMTKAESGLVVRRSVSHPGVQARKWDEQIVEKRRIWAQRLLSLALARACRKSKYGG